MTFRAWMLGLGLILLGASASPIPAEERSKWEFELLPYAWIPGQFGTLNVKGRTAPIDVSVREGLEIATGGNAFFGTGYLSASYERWSAFVDAFGGYAEVATAQKIPTRFCTLCIASRARLLRAMPHALNRVEDIVLLAEEVVRPAPLRGAARSLPRRRERPADRRAAGDHRGAPPSRVVGACVLPDERPGCDPPRSKLEARRPRCRLHFMPIVGRGRA